MDAKPTELQMQAKPKDNIRELLKSKKHIKLFLVTLYIITSAHVVNFVIYFFAHYYIFINIAPRDSDIRTIISLVPLSMWISLVINVFMCVFSIDILIKFKKQKMLSRNLIITFLVISAIMFIIGYDLNFLIFCKFNLIYAFVYDPIRMLLSFIFGVLPAIIWTSYFIKLK